MAGPYVDDTQPAVKQARAVKTKLGVVARATTSTPAAASAVAALTMGSAGITLTFGTGAPSQTQPQGSLYIRTDGSSTSTRMYINTDGATTWTNFTTAA